MNERILNLLSLCLQAKEKGHDCFFDYSPHVNEVGIQIHKGGWTYPVKGEQDEWIKGSDNLTVQFYFRCVFDEYYSEAKVLGIISDAEDYIKGLIT